MRNPVILQFELMATTLFFSSLFFSLPTEYQEQLFTSEAGTKPTWDVLLHRMDE